MNLANLFTLAHLSYPFRDPESRETENMRKTCLYMCVCVLCMYVFICHILFI